MQHNHINHHRHKPSSSSLSKQPDREPHPTLNELEAIVNLPRNQWLPKLQNLKWKGNERINIEKWKNILEKLKEPINSIDTSYNHSSSEISLIYAILNIYVTLITHSSRHTMHNFDILSIDSLQKMIDLDDINILIIVLDVWNVFWHRSGGTMQFEHQDLKKKIVGLCHNILQNEFTLPIPENLQYLTKMSSLSAPINKTHLSQWTRFAQTIKIPKEYCIQKHTQITKQLKFNNNNIFNDDNQLRKAINHELESLKQQISLPSEKEFVLKWRMYFAAQCNNLSARQNFIRLRIKALLVLSTFAQQYSSILRDFLSDIDFAELSLELTELVELTTIPLHFTTPNSPSPPNHHHTHRYPSSPKTPNSPIPLSPIPLSPNSAKLYDITTIPNDIRISGLLCLKNFVFQVPIPFEQLRSIWDENSFVPATLRSIINDLHHEPESLSTLKFATQFLNFLHSTITRTLPQMVGIHQFLDWNSMVQQVLTLISNKNIRDCAVLKECGTLLYVILAKQRKPQTFIQFKGLQLCFELIFRIMDKPNYLTNLIVHEYQDMKCMDVVNSSFSYHMIQQYTQQHLISKLLESCMQSVRLSRQPIQYLRDPLVAKIMNQLISKCYTRPKQIFKPSQFTPKMNNISSSNNNHDEDNDTTMTEHINTDNENKHATEEIINDKIRPFAMISDSATPPPASKRQKNKVSVPQFVLPIVPIPTDNYGHEVYQITCKMISVCIQNGAGLGVGKIFHEYGVTSTFVTSLTKQGVPNRSQVFQIVVECLRAICLYQPALDMIMESGVIECLIRCFANPNYTSQLTAEAAGFFAKKMEELLRHNRKLQPYGIKAIVRTLKQLRNKPYLELQEMYNSPIYFQDNTDITRDDIFPLNDDEEMQLICNPIKPKSDKKDIYPLFPNNDKIKKRVIYPKEPCFTGDNEAFWSAVTNIGKFLETSLKKFTQWEFVKNGGMDALVQLSYDPIMHTVAAMKTKVFKADKKEKKEVKDDSDKKKQKQIKMKDVTAEISAKFGSLVVPATNPKMTTAQKAVANSYPHIEDTQWPHLINKLLDTFKVVDIDDKFVKRFHYYSLDDVNGDLKALKIKHQELADALKTGSRITCLFSILTRLMRRADIKIIHKSKFYLFMKCLSDIIPGILWYMSCSDTNSVHEQASKLRREVLGLLSNDEKKEKEKEKEKDGDKSDKKEKNHDDDEENNDNDDDDVDMTQNDNKNNKLDTQILKDDYDGVFINIRYYECQVVSLMNHFTKFFKNALRIYRRSQDGRQRNQFLVQNNQNVVEYMSHMLHILIAFRAPLLLGKNDEAVFDFWSITQFYEYVCHIIEAMAFTSHKTIVEGLIKSFIQYGGLRRIVEIFRYFVHCLNLTLNASWNNNTNDGKAYILSFDTENPTNPLNSIIHGAKLLFIKSEHSDDEDIKIRFCTESLDQKKKKNVTKDVDNEQEKRKKEEQEKSKYGMNGVVENLKSVVIQFYNFLYSLMKAGNVLEVHRDFRRYLAVELAALLKSSWITHRDEHQYFKPTDFALIDKIVDSTNEYITICSAYNLEYPPPEIKEEEKEQEKKEDNEKKSSKEEEEKKEMDVDEEEDDDGGDNDKDDNKENKNEKVVIDPARQNAIDQLLSIVPDDRELVVYALDALRESAPNNVSVALEWIFTHQEAWKKKKETEAQQEKDATMNDDDVIKYYFKSIDKKEFGVAITTAFYDENDQKEDDKSLVYLKSDKNTFNAPIYWEYYPLFTDISNELIAPLIGLIDKMPSEDQEKWTFRPMSRPDQVEKLLKRIALLIKVVHKSIGDIKMKCLNKKQIWQEQQQASYKEMKKRRVAELIEAQEIRKAEILSKKLAKKEAAERKKKQAELAELEKNKPKEIVDNVSDESYDEDEELRLAMQMSMMEQSDEANDDDDDGQKAEPEPDTEIVPVPIDDGAPPVDDESDAKMQVEEDSEEEEEQFESEYYDEDDVEETEEMRKLLVFPNPPMYKQNQTEILLYSIKTLLCMFNTPRYPNNHAAAYCFAILQDAEPRTIFIAQENGLLQTICELIEECCKNLSDLRVKYVDRDLEEKMYNECKTQNKKYQSLATTYYIIITGFLNKKAIRTLKENLLEDINRTHPHLYKNVTTQIAALDKETSAKKKEAKDKESVGKNQNKKKISFDEDDDDDDVVVEIKEIMDKKDKDDGDVTMGMVQETETETKPDKKSKYQIKKEKQEVKKVQAKLDLQAKKKEEYIKNKQEFDILYGYINKKCDKIQLETSHKNYLWSSCLKLLNLFTWKPYFNSSNHSLKPKYYLRFQCEPNLLNRILTILESITSEYKYAKMLLNCEGYKCILNCSTTSSSATNTRISSMATSIIRHMFDEPSILTDAMIRQIKLSFEHLRKTFTGKQKSASSPFANLSGTSTPESAVFTQLFDPYMPLSNFMNSFKSLATRNESSFYNAVKNSCLIVRDEKSKLMISSRELLNKYALTLRQEAKQNGKWQSQDPRTVQWLPYTDTDCIRIESVYQEFVNRFINGNLQNFHSLPSTVTVHFDGQAFNVDVREYKQKNNTGGARKIRRRRLNLEEKRKNALQAKKEKEEREKLIKEKQEKEKEKEKKTETTEQSDDKPVVVDDKLDENKNEKKSEKEEAEDDDGDVTITEKEKEKEKDKKILSPSRSPMKIASKVTNKYPMCRPYLEEHKTDDKVLASFEAPLNALMSIIVQTTVDIKDYCITKRVEMKNDERERRIKKKKEAEQKEQKQKEKEKEKEKQKAENNIVVVDVDVDQDIDIDIVDKDNNKNKKTDNEFKIEEDDDELEDALPSMSAMQTILGGCRLFAISDMLKILNDIIGNYPKFSSLVVNFNANTGTLRSTSFVQFMIDELIPYSSPLNESKNVVKPDKSTIASNLLKSIAGLNQDKNQLSDQNATKFVLSTLVKHIGHHSNKLYQLSTWTELEKQPSLAGNKWNPMERMNKKLVKKHENKILEQLYQVKSNLEVLRDFVKTPSDRFCRFAARILTDSEVIDTVCQVLESKFDYGYCKNEITNKRIIGNGLAHSVELKSNFLNPIAKLLHNICEIDSINPIYNQLKSQRRKSRKRKSMDNTLMDVDNKSIDNTAPTSPLLECDPMINDGIIHSTSDERAANNTNNLVQFISDISGQMGVGVGDIDAVQFEVEQVVIGGDGNINIEDRNYAVIDFDDNHEEDEDMVDSQDMNDESNANTELVEEDDDDDDDEDDEHDEEDEEDDEQDEEDDEEDDEDEDEEDEEDEEQYNDENLDRLYGQYVEDEADGFYDDDDDDLNEYDEYGEEDIDDDDDDDDDEVDVPTSVHRIANDFMDDLGGASDDFRQFFLRSQRFANIRRLDSILNGDESTTIPHHSNRSGAQPQIHFVNQNPRSGNITSTSVFQIPPFDAQSLININNTSSAIPTMQPMLQMVQQHNALLQQSGISGPSSGNIAVHYPPPPMNVHIPHDLQQRYRLHHANRHGLHRVGADVPQSSSTLFQRAFGDSPEARRPRSLMAIYRLIDRPATSYFNSTDVQNELYNSTTNTSSSGTRPQQRRSNANAQNDIMNHFNRIQRFYDAPHRRIGGNAANNDANSYRNEQTILAQNLMRDYVNGNWVGINQTQMSTQNLNELEEQFGALVPEIAPDSNANNNNNNGSNVENNEDIVVDANAVLDDEQDVNSTFVPIVPGYNNNNNNNAEPAPVSNVVVNNNNNTQSPAVNNNNNAASLNNITDQVSNLLRTMPGMNMFANNNNAENNNNSNNNNVNVNNNTENNNNNAAGGLDALTSQIFGMINRNNNNNNASLLEVIPSPSNNDNNDASTNNNIEEKDENKQSMEVDQLQEENDVVIPPPAAQDVQQSTSENKQNVESSAQTTVEENENKESKAPEEKQDTSNNAMDVDATVAADNTDNTNNNNNNNNNNANDDSNSVQALLTRLEREIENNPIWNYSEMLNFDPDVILSLPEIIRNDIIPPEFQNEVGTYLSMYQAQIAQRDIQQRRVDQQLQQQQPPAPSDNNADNANNTENTDNVNAENKENKENNDNVDNTENNDDVVMDDNTNNNNDNEDPTQEPPQPPESKQEDSATMDVDTNAENNPVSNNNNNNDNTDNDDIPQTLPALNNNTNANNPAVDADAAFAVALAAQLNQPQQQPPPQQPSTIPQNNAANTNNNANNNNNAPTRNVIDPSVLAALPPDIQQEILREQQRNTVMQMTQNNEMDHATALLTVDPQTRMEMLMELNDDASLQKLPSHLLAEAIMLRNRRGYGMGGRWGFRRGGRGRGRGAYGMGDIASHANSQPLSAWEVAARERNNNINNNSNTNNNNNNNNNQSEEKKEEKKEENNKDNNEEKKDKKDKEKEKDKENDKDEDKKKRKKRSPEENRQLVIRKLCKESTPSIRNRIISQYKPPINILSLNSLLKIMETSEVGHSELVLRGIFARLCKYQRLRFIIFNSLFDQLTFASPRYTSIQETALNNNENRARLRRSLALIRYLMQSSTTAGYLVKYMQLPTDFEIFVQGTPPKKAKLNNYNNDVEMKDNSNSNTNNNSLVIDNNNFDMSKCRILTLFSLFGSPMLKNQSILQSFVETLSMLCKSNEMYLSHLQISINPQDIKHLVSLISDHIRCNDSIFTKLNNVAKSIMNVPSNKRSLTSQIIAESHNLSAQISKELNTIYKIISPSKHSSKRLMKSWTITTKQNALLRNIEFLNKLISSTACRKFNTGKEMSKIKLLHADANDAEIEEFLKEKKELHAEQLLLLTECSKGMEQLWIALDRCLEVFGYVPKEILLKQIKNSKEKEKEKKEKKGKKEEKENDKKENEKPELEMEQKSSQKTNTHFTNEEEAMKAKMNQQHAILKKQTNKEEDARITSSVERLKPLIRAFFILHDFYSVDEFLKEKTPEQLHNDLIADGGENSIASTYLVSRYEYFLRFTDIHRNIFNLLIAHKPKLLISDIKNDNIYPFSRGQTVSNKYGAFAALVWHPKRVLDFDNKKMFLRDELKKLKEKLLLSRRGFDGGVGRVRICVRRKQLFADAFAQIKQWSRRELMSRLSVKFLGEDGVDAGGLTREFYQAMSYEMFNPNYSLFIPTNDNKSVFQPNLNSGYTNPTHLEDFKFVGLMCAKAIYDEQVLDAYFTRSFLKHVLGIKPNWHDLQSLDFQHYKNLKWMLEHTIDNVIFENFTYNVNTYGVKKEYVLKKDGDKISVNDQNKKEYIKLIADFKMTKQISQQIKSFKEGLHILIPHWLISIFTWPELDLLICGLPDIDIKDMMQNTEYHGGLTKNTKQIKWFWQCVQEMDKEERALLLQFITGTSKVPIGGFKALPGMDGIQRLQIHSCGQMNSQITDNLLPSAHTCFNQLDLPKYSTKQILNKKIMLAIRECSQGFAFS